MNTNQVTAAELAADLRRLADAAGSICSVPYTRLGAAVGCAKSLLARYDGQQTVQRECGSIDWSVVECALIHAEATHEDSFDTFSRRLARCLPNEKDENIHSLCDSRNCSRTALRKCRVELRKVREIREPKRGAP